MKNITFLFAILFAAGLNSSRAQDTWVQKADFGGTARCCAVGFCIGEKGYIGTGYDGSYKNDFWEYNPATNVWTQKANFGGTARLNAVGFSIGSKGYLGTGNASDGFKNDFWEYDPSTNVWTQKANFGGTARYSAIGFSIGSEGYIGTGFDSAHNLKNDFWEYDSATNVWTQEANFGGTARLNAVGFSIGSKGYIGTGYNNNVYPNIYNDFWEYDPTTNAWTQKTDSGGTARWAAVGFSIGNRGYIGTGEDNGLKNDFWEYTPDISSCAVPTNLSATNITSSSAKLSWDANAALGYKVKYKIANASGWTIISTSVDHINISGLSAQTEYAWRIRSVCSVGPKVYSDWSEKQTFTTGVLRIGDEPLQQISFQIYPNPAQDHATIQFTLLQSSHVYIKVYDVSGKEIATLLDEDIEQGEHSLQLNTTKFSKGVYTVRMISNFGIENQKLIVE